MEIFTDMDELKTLMDKVILRTLELVEEYVTLKINIEKLTNEGALMMAKTRYAQGPNSVSLYQLPAESDEGREFQALKTINRTKSEMGVDRFELEIHSVDKDSGRIEPIHWFGILIPQFLKTARDRYEKATELVIQSINIEQQLKKNCDILSKLKSIRNVHENITTAEE